MAREKEVKINLKIPLNLFIKRIHKKGFKKVDEIKQSDIYFDRKDWYLYRHLSSLRFRKVNSKDDSFTFKKMFYLPHKKDKYYIEEIEVKKPFNERDKFNKIFKKLEININIDRFKYRSIRLLTNFLASKGYYDEQKMKKSRTIYKSKDNEVTIDDVDDVGTIVELECKKEEPLKIISKLLRKEEWARSLEGTGYIWLRNKKGLNEHIKNRKKFFKEPDWNVWKHEVEFYKNLISE